MLRNLPLGSNMFNIICDCQALEENHMVSRMKQVKTIDEYISMFPDNVQVILEKLRQTIKESAPGSEEAISYQMPTFKLNGNLVHFAAFKDHIGFFPTSTGRVVFKKELSKYKGGKGTVQFPIDKPIPFDLVQKIVKYRMKENLKKN
jgi:uncharacterized protein YdhG (YjbR/CyaY superfamily)